MRPPAINYKQYSDPLAPELRAWVREQRAEIVWLLDDCGNRTYTTYGALEAAITMLFFSGASVIYNDSGDVICIRYASVHRMPESERLRQIVRDGHYTKNIQLALTGWKLEELKALRKQVKGK